MKFLIGATNSGCGKTTLTMGLLRALRRKGLRVQPFKCGPDYIDTQYHRIASGRESVNLDGWFASPEHLREVFDRYSRDADVSIVEGVMGLLDGYDHQHGSSAELAEVLGIPVVLIINAKSMAYSVAAIMEGYKRYAPNLAGVIFNHVGSERHEQLLRQACQDVGVACWGMIPRIPDMAIPHRHLGLSLENEQMIERLVEQAADAVEKYVEVPFNMNGKKETRREEPEKGDTSGKHIAIARDEAFNFTYRENIDLLKTWGEVTFFSPLHDRQLPEGTDFLYLPGGYPEFFLEELSTNETMLRSIHDYIEQGGQAWAECGGMMYLCRNIIDADGRHHPMVGVLPQDATMQGMRLHLGYRAFLYNNREWRGHEFHYSTVVPAEEPLPLLEVEVKDARGQVTNTPVYHYKNLFASYIHLYLPEKESSQRRSSSPNLHPVMFAGTGSDVGKSIVATAFCRIFRQDGYHPAPFKAQNMALNSYATPEGYEIGRAQAVQAEAAGVPCHTDMNPLLLKPNSDHTSQVVLNGKPVGNYHAREYFHEGKKPAGGITRNLLRQAVHEAFDRLSARFCPIVMEGAGSIAEVNLRDMDLVNMSMAMYAQADVILVADIDRGGVFASVYGTIMLLRPEERRRIKGIIINKFRGDMSLFDDGRRILEELCGIPVLGVLPYFKDIHIEEEDSVSLEMKSREARQGKVNVAVVMLRHISNFTDFDVLERDSRIHLFYTNNTEEVRKADIIILPGSKSTIADLVELRRNGVAQAILQAHRDGKTVLGICGGYQMMGQEVLDPQRMEGDVERMPGLGLLPISTTMGGEKRTVQTIFRFLDYPDDCHGYEIHMGKTMLAGGSPVNTLPDGHTEGCYLSQKCMGTYMHGILDNPVVVNYLLEPYLSTASARASFDYAAYKEEQYDRLAAEVRKHVNMEKVYAILSRG